MLQILKKEVNIEEKQKKKRKKEKKMPSLIVLKLVFKTTLEESLSFEFLN